MLALIAGTSVEAQTVTGQVVDSLTRSAVGSGFVVLLGPEGRELDRTLTTHDGRFTFRLAADLSGPFRLRSERIGYALSVSEPIQLSGDEPENVLLWVRALPRMLAEIAVEESTECRLERGAQTTAVWEEVRKALAAASWTESQELYRIVSNVYQRDMDGRHRLQAPEHHWPHRGAMTSPFVSRSPSALLAEGYVVERGASADYYAPDAHVLQDERFLATHCFRLTIHEEDSSLVGLAFEPAPSRRLPDVEGVLWLNGESFELQALEYEYTNLPRTLQSPEPGRGTIDFLPLPSGAWIVRRWEIGIPTSVHTERIDRFDREPRRVVDSFRENGGEVLSVADSTGTNVYRAAMAELVVNVMDSGGRSAPGVLVSVENTWFEGVSDGSGVARIVAPLNGEYGVVFSTADTDALDYAPTPRRLQFVRGESTTLRLELPSLREMVEELCDAPVTGSRYRVLVGTVRDSSTGLPVSGARVTTSWQEIEERPVAFAYRDRYATSTTDDEGYYAICGLEFARPTMVFAEKDSGASEPVRVVFEPGRVHVGDTAYETSLPYARLDLTMTSARTDRLYLTGIATDAVSGDGLAGVSVTASGVEGFTRSDSSGAFRLAAPQGTHTITLSKPGYATRKTEIEISNDRPNLVGMGVAALTPVVQIVGSVRELQSGEGLSRVWLTLLNSFGDSIAITISDTSGNFSLTAPQVGTYQVSARRIGYAPYTTDILAVSDQPVGVELAMEPLGYELEPISVVGEATVPHLSRNGFYRRQREGLGFFLERGDIERRAGASKLADLLRGINGVRVGRHGLIRLRGGLPSCDQRPPAVWLDGVQMLVDPTFSVVEDWHLIIHLMDVEAMEVYTSPAELPAQYNTGGDAACGVILIWTRRGA